MTKRNPVPNPKADFALKFKMITESEYQACLKDDMSIERGNLIFNANASKDVTPVPTPESFKRSTWAGPRIS